MFEVLTTGGASNNLVALPFTLASPPPVVPPPPPLPVTPMPPSEPAIMVLLGSVAPSTCSKTT